MLGRARPRRASAFPIRAGPTTGRSPNSPASRSDYYPYFDPRPAASISRRCWRRSTGSDPDDIVLLHGCCHNPTGANLTNAQWDKVAASLTRTGAFPLVDLAYLGFGDGLDEDAYGVRKVVSSVPEVDRRLLGSKNFGLYRERVGVAIAIASDEAEADIAFSQLLNVIRGAYFAAARPRRRNRPHHPRGQGTARRVGDRAQPTCANA